MNEDLDSEEDLLNEARRRPSPAARAIFLDKACGEDSTLRKQIETRLKAAGQPEDSPARPPVPAEKSSPPKPMSGRRLAWSSPNGEQPKDLPAQQAAVVTRRLGNYLLLSKLGEGGMGVVYKARQLGLQRLVALKVMKSAGQFARRFELEMQALAQLDHPNIVSIYDAGKDGGEHYFSMRLVTGGSLMQQRKRSVGDLQAAVELVAKVARAVHHAHEKGILHRDLKPSNILLDPQGEPHVTDFGLAKFIKQKADLTQTGMILGTPDYMAPEQAQGNTKHLGKEADIFSLGVILYELITGRHPFHRGSPLETLVQVVEANPERPGSVNPQVDDGLQAVCLKCLEKDPGRRYRSAEALAEALECCLKQARQSARAGFGEPDLTQAESGQGGQGWEEDKSKPSAIRTPNQGPNVKSFKPIRVVLADDHPIVRAGIREALQQLPGVEVIGEAGDGREAIEMVKSLQPDMVLMDISMPGLNGLEATERILEAFPQVRVIILSRHENEEMYWRALQVGASGYLLKKAAIMELKAALKRVASGEIYLSEEIATRLRHQLPLKRIAHARNPVERLSARQREILQLIAEGQTTPAIALILKISAGTVDYHRRKLMQELNIFDVAGLVRFALRTGLISQEG